QQVLALRDYFHPHGLILLSHRLITSPRPEFRSRSGPSDGELGRTRIAESGIRGIIHNPTSPGVGSPFLPSVATFRKAYPDREPLSSENEPTYQCADPPRARRLR